MNIFTSFTHQVNQNFVELSGILLCSWAKLNVLQKGLPVLLACILDIPAMLGSSSHLGNYYTC